jgi:hypothetical protein
MAIDFMILPLSRYISGDFITPVMELAWKQGLRYTIIGPDGPRDRPKGVPFGGPDAAARRELFLGMLDEDLAALPISSQLWDERSNTPLGFHRVDGGSYAALAEEASRLGRHSAATLFLPCEFTAPFEMKSPFERLTGSTPAALRELEESWSNAFEPARGTLLEALRDSARLCLPMIVDF